MNAKRKRVEPQPMFEFTEDGKFISLPLNPRNVVVENAAGGKNSGNKMSITKPKFIPYIMPLNFNKATDNPAVNAKGVRKELFKTVPKTMPVSAKKSLGTTRKIKKTGTRAAASQAFNFKFCSPKCKFPYSRNTLAPKIPEILVTPPQGEQISKSESADSDKEFTKLEQLVSEQSSPMSNINQLLKNTKLSEPLNGSSNSLEAELQQIFNEYNQKTVETHRIIETALNKHENNFNQLQDRVLTLLRKTVNNNNNNNNNNNSDKENSVRRSRRLSLRSSPGPASPNNLRIATLNRNLSRAIQTPKTQKALKFYNSMRGSSSILATPKMDFNNKENGNKADLSQIVLGQCLLLQETPRPN